MLKKRWGNTDPPMRSVAMPYLSNKVSSLTLPYLNLVIRITVKKN